MSRCILALDPGTTNTGWAKLRQAKSGWQVNHGTNVSPKMRGQGFKVKWQVAEIAELILTPPRATEVWLEAYFPFKWHKSASYQLMLSGGLMTVYESLAKVKIQPRIKGTSRSVPPKVWKDWIRRLAAASFEASDKEAMREVVTNLYLEELDYELQTKASGHAIDALGVGLFAIHHDLASYKGVE